MKDIHELIRQKETELERVQREIEALRLTAKLLEETGRVPAAAAASAGATTAFSTPPSKPQPVQPVATPAAWASAKQFP